MAQQSESFALGASRPGTSWIEVLARLGYAAKGVVYIVIGVLALRAALGDGGGATTDSRGALAVIGNGTFGEVALGIIAVGLLGYALWRVIAAWKDTEGKGDDAKGIAQRIGQVGRALAYGALGVAAIRLLTHASQSTSDNAEQWTARGLSTPLGKWLVVAVGAGIGVYALYQVYRAFGKNLRKRLDLRDADPHVVQWVERFGRFGIAARAVVFGIIAFLLIRAGLRYEPSSAGGIGDSLATLRSQPYGSLLLAVVAAGLVAYGLFQFANARYRRVHVH